MRSLTIPATAEAADRFKGTDSTFGGFPERLQHILSETIEHSKVECIVFPAYEVRSPRRGSPRTG